MLRRNDGAYSLRATPISKESDQLVEVEGDFLQPPAVTGELVAVEVPCEMLDDGLYHRSFFCRRESERA